MKRIDRLREKYANDRFFEEVFKSEIYKEAFDLGQVDTVVDVGACAGEFSFYIYPHAKHIYAIEPEASEYIELVDNIYNTGCKRIRPYHLALSNINGLMHLRVFGRGGHFVVTDKSEDSMPVQSRTLNTFLEEEGIESVDILKIDIENGEDKVFSAPDIDKAMKKIKFICGEHGNLDLIEKHGFLIERTGHGWIAKKQ